MSAVLDSFIVAFVATLLLGPSIVCAYKGKPFLAIALGVPAIYGAITLAKPDSAWARHFYRGDKLARAQARVTGPGGRPSPGEEPDAELLAAWEGVDIDPAELDSITRRALRRAGRIP